MSEKDLVFALTRKLEIDNIEFDREIYVRSHIADVVVRNEVAIEAKLSDITKAMFQCVAYSSRYKYVYLYMPIEKKSLVLKHKEKLRKLGIRWFFLEKDNSFKFGNKKWEKALFA